jgi:ring-1,2-phenylacetyl-CoA epoxidase subunit PaaD
MTLDLSKIRDRIMNALETVKDPEIDSVSVIDLGMVENVFVHEGNVSIQVLPTFSGCPALEIIEKNIEYAVENVEGVKGVRVEFVKSPPWTSERITARGRERLKEFGIAPPPIQFEAEGSWTVNCPYCDSTYTTLDNLFGPTACRSILYCRSCKNPFEAMKPISTLM